MELYAEFFALYPQAFHILVFVASLSIGSFLNVVIYRTPVMMKNQWRSDCKELFQDEVPALKKWKWDTTKFNLVVPASTCPKCKNSIKPWHNIPVISWLLLKGQCAYCSESISSRYPIVELMTAMLSVAVSMNFGVSWQCLGFLFLTWFLVALSLIDFDTMFLPDELTYPLLWLGLLFSLLGVGVTLSDAIIGAMAGYLSLWSVYWAFKLLTGKEGMGYGDFKLLAALGAWLGWQHLPLIILLSSAVGLVFAIVMMVTRGQDRNIPIPFGPYLAIAGWIAMMWGDQLISAYLAYSGIR